MSTVALTIYTSAYPSITNNIEIRVYKQTDTAAIVQSLNHVAPHLDDVWSFPGLDRTNYLFRIFEMSGSTIVQQLGNDMYVNPNSNGGVSFRATEQIEADVTTGFFSGVNSVAFDGSAGKEDWRGWDIASIERIGLGTMKRGVDYSYNMTTGVFTLLQPGDLFGHLEWYNVEFQANSTAVTDSVGVPLIFSSFLIKTANYTIATGDFGGVIICRPSGDYMELTLPAIATVPAGKQITIELGAQASQKCVKILTNGSDFIDWLLGNRNNLYLCNQESITLYKFIDPAGPTPQWRVYNPFGNFLQVGEQIPDDMDTSKIFNKAPMNGTALDALKYARLYNDYVLQLPTAQRVNYDDWSTGTNKYLYSLANSTFPTNAGKFLIPDWRNKFERVTDGTRIPGNFQLEAIGQHFHDAGTETDPAQARFQRATSHNVRDWGGSPGVTGQTGSTDINAGPENRPANVAINKYIRV